MDKKELKKLMTDLAKGKVTQKEVDKIIGKNTHKRSKKLNQREVNKNSK